ncbi:hypothetical protein [Blastococcus sp. Marseille-P5729]|uniref:hypothetical protein n=1 Tax=Blastococcus sp. Marseille-P5729 TaxID=2086582 RepID=UPI00131A7467|nr:hypothetical protein [Blastococcus sp. Marseille-P5729]
MTSAQRTPRLLPRSSWWLTYDHAPRCATDLCQQTRPAGDLLIIPPARHDLEALDDSAVLLTVVIAC